MAGLMLFYGGALIQELPFEEAYCEEQASTLVDEMRLKFRIVGEGIIGQASFTRRNNWIFSDSYSEHENQATFKDKSEFQDQFLSSGIKTIAVIAVESRGVLQFGSTEKISEGSEFLGQIKKLFDDIGNIDGLILAGIVPSSNEEDDDANWVFPSPLPSEKSFDGFCKELTGKPSSPRMTFMQQSSSQQQLDLQSVSSVVDSATDTICTSPWSGECSMLTSFETLLPSNDDIWDSPFSSPIQSLPGPWESTVQDISSVTLDSFHSTGEPMELQKPFGNNFRKSTDNLNSDASVLLADGLLTDGLLDSVTSLPRISEEFMPAVYSSDISSYLVADGGLSECFVSSPLQDTDLAGTAMASDISCVVEVSSVSSGLVNDVLGDTQVKYQAKSVQSSNTDALPFAKSTVVHSTDSNPFNSLNFGFGTRRTGECLEDIFVPMINGNSSTVSTQMPGSVSWSDIGCTSSSQTGLFSTLGLEELLKGASRADSAANSTVDDQFPATKRRKTECSSSNFNRVQLEGLSISSGSINLMQHLHTLDRTNSASSRKDIPAKSQVGLWINDSYSNNIVHNAIRESKKAKEPPKAMKKRAKPGQSTRPRPKDRQMIQDRLKELRGIIPDGGKCSIDSLLERTVKYMCFLQGVTKYADKLTQADGAKLVGSDKGGGYAGATCAYEVGDQTMGCPVIVEDLYPPGQMLIEMLCEDRGFFLEIADIIKGFGLNILKGVMEARDDKIWARFIVGAKKQVTRLDILWSLIQLVQQTVPPKEFNVDDYADSSKGRIFPRRKYG